MHWVGADSGTRDFLSTSSANRLPLDGPALASGVALLHSLA